MKHKTIQQLRDNLKKVLKRARPKQLKKLQKAYHGKRLKKWWSSYASWECCTIGELKDVEHVGHRMKGGKRYNHIYNVCNRRGVKNDTGRTRQDYRTAPALAQRGRGRLGRNEGQPRKS